MTLSKMNAASGHDAFDDVDDVDSDAAPHYGTVSLVPNKEQLDRFAWRIVCEPHVTIRMKRVFSKMDVKSQGEHFISDTIENARDLIWFLERYPMAVADKDYLDTRAAQHRERETVVKALISRRQEPLCFDLAIAPRDYQRMAATLLLEMQGLLLADDVGTGKTVSAICTFADARTLPAVVVTLAHLPRQWKDEINRFAPNLNVHIAKIGTPYDMTQSGKLPPPDVILLSYHKLAGWAETLARYCKSVTYDEVQELRRAESAKYRAAHFLSSKLDFRLGLSATPIYNFGGEFHTVMDVLKPGALGTRSEYIREWCSESNGTDEKASISDPKALGIHVRHEGLMLRRTRRDIGRELPPLTKIIHEVGCDTTALLKVNDACAELARIILRENESFKGEKMQASEEFSNLLRQATGIAKASYVAEFVRMVVEGGEKVVLFGWHRAVYKIWLSRLADFKPVLYTGTESGKQKEANRAAFIEGDSQVLIMSLRSGAGLNGLQSVCRTPIIGELDWAAGVHEQCIGRIDRDGQTDPVTAFFLVADGGCDPFMVDVLGLKAAQLDGIRNPTGDLFENLPEDAGDRVKRLAESYLSKRGIK